MHVEETTYDDEACARTCVVTVKAAEFEAFRALAGGEEMIEEWIARALSHLVAWTRETAGLARNPQAAIRRLEAEIPHRSAYHAPTDPNVAREPLS